MSTSTARRRVLRVPVSGAADYRADLLAVEEPLEIRVDGEPLMVTMRTPGDDIDLAAGFLFTEGLLTRLSDVREIRMCDENVAAVTVADDGGRLRARVRGADGFQSAARNFLATSACGVCGKDSIEAIRVRSSYDVAADPVRVSPAVLAGLPDRLRDAQRVFSRTGGLHAAGLFTPDGTLQVLREDVGRHNAVDKVAGWALRSGLVPLTGHVLLVSGRTSFELAQKALMLGLPVLAAVSAPSSLAVSLAEEGGMTLIGFLRGSTMNVYAGSQRVITEDASAAVG
jgi:FdhD protein